MIANHASFSFMRLTGGTEVPSSYVTVHQTCGNNKCPPVLYLTVSYLQPTTWNGVKNFMSAFSQKDFGPIPCSVVAHILGNPNSDASRPWTPCVPMLRVSMGLPKSGAEICPELNTFMDECSSWVSKVTPLPCTCQQC